MFIAKILLLCVVVGALASATPPELSIIGTTSQLEGQDLVESQEKLKAYLVKLAAGEGPHYRISKVLSASSQVVSGKLDKYSVKLIDVNGTTKVCYVEIWSQRWLINGIEVTFKCPNEPVLRRRFST